MYNCTYVHICTTVQYRETLLYIFDEFIIENCTEREVSTRLFLYFILFLLLHLILFSLHFFKYVLLTTFALYCEADWYRKCGQPALKN